MQTKKDCISMTAHNVHDVENITSSKDAIVMPADSSIFDNEATSERQSRGNRKRKTSTFDKSHIGKNLLE